MSPESQPENFLLTMALGKCCGQVDVRDVQPFVDALMNSAPVSAVLCAYDLTGEGIVNLDDLPAFVDRLLGP